MQHEKNILMKNLFGIKALGNTKEYLIFQPHDNFDIVNTLLLFLTDSIL